MSRKIENAEFTCHRCGTCCRWEGHVLLTQEDITRLSGSTGLSEEAFIERYTALAVNRRELSLVDHPDGSCIFLDENRCRFYTDRPAQCRDFPHSWRVTNGCPALEEMN